MNINDSIIEKLKEIEQIHDVQILFAIESGSRAWGFESKDSDYDVRFIYKHRQSHYLSVFPKRDVIEVPINDDLDIAGWDIKKAMGLLYKSNPALLEWTKSPITYLEQTQFRKELIDLSKEFYSAKKLVYHYLNIAGSKYNSHLQKDQVTLKKYFYALHGIFACQWVEKYDEIPPIEFDKKLEECLDKESELYQIIQTLLEQKKGERELDKGAPILPLNEFINEQIEYFEQFVKNTPAIEPNTELLDQFFQKHIAQTFGVA